MNHRLVKTLLVACIVLYFAAGAVAGAEERREPPRTPNRATLAVKTPMRVVKEVLVIQAKVERTVRTGVLRVGIDVFTRAVQWLQPSRSAPRPL